MKRESNFGNNYSYLLGRVVRKPTPVLYNMIWQLNINDKTEKLVDQICERCKTHPDDVNWITNDKSPFYRLVLINYEESMVKAYRALIESTSFRVFDELDRLKLKMNILSKVLKYLIKKLIILKASDVMEVFHKYHLSLDMSREITSYLYGKKDQLNVLSNSFLRTCLQDNSHACHLIHDWISIDTEVISDNNVFTNIMIDSMNYCNKECCTLAILRNIHIPIELGTIDNTIRSLVYGFIGNGLRNKFICMNDYLMEMFLEILDVSIESSSEEIFATLRFNNSTILHSIAYNLRYNLRYPGDGCCNDKWLSLLSKIVD